MAKEHKLLIKGNLQKEKYNRFITEVSEIFLRADEMINNGIETKMIYGFLERKGIILDFTD